MTPVFELYRKASDEDKPQVAYEIADAAFKITIDEVDGNDNREFLKTLYNAVNNEKMQICILKQEAGMSICRRFRHWLNMLMCNRNLML